MPLPIHKDALQRKPKLVRYFQPGTRGGLDFINSQTEHNFRERGTSQFITSVSSGGGSGSGAAGASGGGGGLGANGDAGPPGPKGDKGDKGDPGTLGIDRFHKEGRTYVTVSLTHFTGEDPISDPAQKHTITDGYNEAVRLVGLLTSNGFTSIDDRVVVVVFGGVYNESLTISNSRVDFQGIGRPKITGITNITSRKILFDNFELYNNPIDPRFPHEAAALIIGPGTFGASPVTNFISPIQIRNCWIHAPLTALWCQAWSHFENCYTIGDSNESTSAHAAVVQWSDPLSWPKKTIFSGGLLSGRNIVSQKLHKGPALGLYAVDVETVSQWVPNSDTAGSGVLLKNLEVDGWTENYGWNLEYHACKCIEGQWINDAGAGSVHHIMHTHSNTEAAAVQASTWFTGGTEADVNYLVYIDDDAGGDPEIGWSNVYLRNMMHAAPEAPAGSVVLPLGGAPQARVFGVHSATTKDFFYEIAGPAEGAILTSCDAGIPYGTPGQNSQGYFND